MDFPVEHDSLIEQLGSVELEAPTGDAVTISAVLERTDETTYRSAEEIYTSVIGNLDEAFIGRKYYDDRAGARDVDSWRESRSL